MTERVVILRKRVNSIEMLSMELSYRQFCETNNDNRKEIARMKAFLAKALKSDLTSRQKFCLCEYYLKGRMMKDIAAELKIDPSAVSRHIKRAVDKLKKRSIYY